MSPSDTTLGLAVRVLQVLFSATVLGLSISLVQGNILGHPPLSLTFAAFVGGVSIVGALSGLATLWVQRLQGRIVLIVDAAIAAFNLAGGVLIAVKLEGVHCKDVSASKLDLTDDDIYKMVFSDIICGGEKWLKGDWVCGYLEMPGQQGMLLSRCRMAQADSAFMLLTVIVVSVAAVLGYLRMRRGY